MQISDPIADMLTRIRNGQARRKRIISFPYSKIKFLIIKLLNKHGFIGAFRVEEFVSPNHKAIFKQISIILKYRGNQPVILALKRVSRPGRRVYVDSSSLPNPLTGLGMAIISTSKGLMNQKEARQKRIGGEVLLYVW